MSFPVKLWIFSAIITLTHYNTIPAVDTDPDQVQKWLLLAPQFNETVPWTRLQVMLLISEQSPVLLLLPPDTGRWWTMWLPVPLPARQDPSLPPAVSLCEVISHTQSYDEYGDTTSFISFRQQCLFFIWEWIHSVSQLSFWIVLCESLFKRQWCADIKYIPQ